MVSIVCEENNQFNNSSGRLLYLIGRSGVGKDTVLNALKPHLDQSVTIIKRYITREYDASGEDHIPVTDEEFMRMQNLGMFSLYWESHGLKYGIGREMEQELLLGRTVIVNGSREYLKRASELFPKLEVIEIYADPDIVTTRLFQRKRESLSGIMERLERGAEQFLVPESLLTYQIDNSGNLLDAVDTFLNILRPQRGTLPVNVNAI
jgi:ribose 1,5-bisphosphokinase